MATAETRPGRAGNGEKLPIYPAPQEMITLVETTHPLSPHIAKVRESVTDIFGQARGYAREGVSRWVGFERKVESEIKTVLPKDEDLTPGIIYVLISGLTGSVLTRTRSLPIRFLTPPLFTLLAMPYFLPKTSHNLRSYLSYKEDYYFPAFAQRHDEILSTASSHLGMTVDRVKGLGDEARGWTGKAVEGVENATGLKVADAIKKGRERAEREKDRLEDVIKRGKTIGGLEKGEIGTERVGYVVEQVPVAEIVRPTPAAVKAVEVKKAEEKRLV